MEYLQNARATRDIVRMPRGEGSRRGARDNYTPSNPNSATLPVVLDVPQAARLLGIGRTLAYELVRTNQWPTPVIRVGRLIKIPSGASDRTHVDRLPDQHRGQLTSRRWKRHVQGTHRDVDGAEDSLA